MAKAKTRSQYDRQPFAEQILTSVRGKRIVLTGKCWCVRGDLKYLIESAGGIFREDVTGSTDVLVRGESDNWLHDKFGLKEAAAAKQIQNGSPLVVIGDLEFQKVLEKRKPGRCMEYVAGQPVAWLLPSPQQNQFDRIARIPGPTDRLQIVHQRTEQSFLRSQLFRNSEKGQCDLCGRELPLSLLVAAHIKPRSTCTTAERLDFSCIVFAACLLGCDALYERGYVSVGDSGHIVTASVKGLPATLREQLCTVRNRACPAWHKGTAKYFASHWRRQFLG